MKKPLDRIIPPTEAVYLDGPKPRINELKFAWDVFSEFIKSFRFLHFLGPCVTVFGSARFKEDHPYYKAAQDIGKHIAELGFTTITGFNKPFMAWNKSQFLIIASEFGVGEKSIKDYFTKIINDKRSK